MKNLTTDDCMDAGDRATQEAKAENTKNTAKKVLNIYKITLVFACSQCCPWLNLIFSIAP